MSKDNLIKYKAFIAGKKLTCLFHTKQAGPNDYRPGIHPAYYFSTVIELDNSVKLRLDNDLITELDDPEELYEITYKNWDFPRSIEFKGKVITDIAMDEDKLILYLENGTTIERDAAYGDRLYIRYEMVTHNNSLGLWHKFYGFFKKFNKS